MDFKICKTEAQYPEVLLYWKLDDDGYPTVVLWARGYRGDGDVIFVDEEIIFDNDTTAKLFIEGFTDEQATKWCIHRKVYYE